VASDSSRLDLTLLPGARALLAIHSRELPQRDDLCGAFCAALALRAAGIEDHEGELLDQDAVALAAGSIVSSLQDGQSLPRGERGRRDYRLPLPSVADAAVSGTTPAGLVRAVERLSRGALVALAYRGPWTALTLAGVFDIVSALERPPTLVANLATRHLWGSHPSADQLLAYLLEGEQTGPPPDWDVGHFVCLVGGLRGPRGSLYAIADTYPSLGSGGIHLQPAERLATAVERRDMPAGGILAIVSAEDASTVRSGVDALGLLEGSWDNGTVTAETPA
jgi:Family of unknown function (DUF6885)